MSSYVILRSSLHGEDDEDTRLLREQAERAESFMRSEPWCVRLLRGMFVGGVGEIEALFLFEAEIQKTAKPEWVWIFVGDLPSAYLEFEGFENAHAALERYIEGLEEWADAVLAGRPVDLQIPLRMEPNRRNAGLLRPRCKSIRELVLPWLSKQRLVLPGPEQLN